MSDSDFKLWDGDYSKDFYDVLLPSGEIVKHCWPNAGWMNDIGWDGKGGRKWQPSDGIHVRLSPDHPMDGD